MPTDSRFGGRIQPITDRRTFDRLHADARVVRSGPLVIRVLDDGSVPPRLGFALGRKFGNAVTRNRTRRRLRHAFIETTEQYPNLSGTFLIGARREVADSSFEKLRKWLDSFAERSTEESVA